MWHTAISTYLEVETAVKFYTLEINFVADLTLELELEALISLLLSIQTKELANWLCPFLGQFREWIPSICPEWNLLGTTNLWQKVMTKYRI